MVRQDSLTSLDPYLTELRATAFWSGVGGRFDLAAIETDAEDNRWNLPGDPAVYLAGDLGVALVEAGRHAGKTDGGESTVWSVDVDAHRVLDLREPGVARRVHGATGLAYDERYWFLDREACRRLAAELRSRDTCSAIVTQSAGLPDDPTRWNLVLFSDRLRRPLAEVIRRPRRVGVVRLRA